MQATDPDVVMLLMVLVTMLMRRRARGICSVTLRVAVAMMGRRSLWLGAGRCVVNVPVSRHGRLVRAGGTSRACAPARAGSLIVGVNNCCDSAWPARRMELQAAYAAASMGQGSWWLVADEQRAVARGTRMVTGAGDCGRELASLSIPLRQLGYWQDCDSDGRGREAVCQGKSRCLGGREEMAS